MALIDNNALTGAQRSASAALQQLFGNLGLDTLAPKINQMLLDGYSAELIQIMLTDTAEYKTRFAGNEKRRAAGLPVLSPANYLALESSYRAIMSAAGLPAGFYDQASDFTNWIANDVSPDEVQSRVRVASDLVYSVDSATRQAFGQWYSDGDMIAYALDRQVAAPLLEKQFKAAQMAGAASNQGVGINIQTGELLAENGISADQARQGFGVVAQGNARRGILNDIYGDGLQQEDLVKDVLLDDAAAGVKRKGLASKERANFSGTSGASGTSLTRDQAGRF